MTADHRQQNNLKNILRTPVRKCAIIFDMLNQKSPFEPRPIKDVIHDAFNQIDMKTIEILRRMTMTERLELLFELCDAVREMAEFVEQKNYPDAPKWEIQVRVNRRVVQANDLNFKEVVEWGQSIGALDGWKIEY